VCVKISSENFILNYFVVKGIGEASLKDLANKKYAIEKIFDKNVYIDLYKSSIRETIYYNSKYLSSEKDAIKCELKNIIKDNVLDDLNSSLPPEIKEKYLEEMAV
jgi:hypothetical protein